MAYNPADDPNASDLVKKLAGDALDPNDTRAEKERKRAKLNQTIMDQLTLKQQADALEDA